MAMVHIILYDKTHAWLKFKSDKIKTLGTYIAAKFVNKDSQKIDI